MGSLSDWQENYGSGPLSVRDGTGDGGQGAEIAELGLRNADWRAVRVSARSDREAASDTQPVFEDSYFEEVDRAMEQLAAVPSGVRSFGEMVARRGIKRVRVARD